MNNESRNHFALQIIQFFSWQSSKHTAELSSEIINNLSLFFSILCFSKRSKVRDAAYAAAVSLMNTTKQIMDHPHLATSFDPKQMESLRDTVDSLLDFMESCTSHGGTNEARDLESQIASAAEDVIESHVVDQIHAGFDQTSLNLPLNLQKVIDEMDSVKLKAEKEWSILRNMQPTYPKSTKPLTAPKMDMVGNDEELLQLLDVLTGHDSSRHIICIVGMGGIGKTTLTRNAFENRLIIQHFDICGWVTISQSLLESFC